MASPLARKTIILTLFIRLMRMLPTRMLLLPIIPLPFQSLNSRNFLKILKQINIFSNLLIPYTRCPVCIITSIIKQAVYFLISYHWI